MQATYNRSETINEVLQRRVIVTIPAGMNGIFDDKDGSFFKSRLGKTKNIVEMKTHNGKFQSSTMRIGILGGDELVEKLKRVAKANSGPDWGFQTAEIVASDLYTEFNFKFLSSEARKVLLIRGLRPALDQYAKKPDYKPEFRFVMELIMAKMTISYGVAILQAIRKENDQEKILRALALSCYHFHLLTQRRSNNDTIDL